MNLKLILCLALALSGGLFAVLPASLRAQESPGFDVAAVHTLITNLLGKQPFSSTVEVQSRNASFPVTASIGFCADGEKYRSYSDMANLKSDSFTPDAAAIFKKRGVDRTIMITRLDQNLKFVIYPGLRAYIKKPVPIASGLAASPLKIVRALQGQSTIDGHPCNQCRVDIIQAGSTNFSATIWEARDLQNFPIQIELGDAAENMLRLQFHNLKFGPLDTILFEVPTGYRCFADVHEMLHGGPAITASSASATPETKADVTARIIKSQQELADKGDADAQLRMGLRYRDGDGMPRDLDLARELLQDSANQGNAEASVALARLNPKPKPLPKSETAPNAEGSGLLIQNAEFGTGGNMADVTDQVSELLRTKAAGFTINSETLGVDPKPGKKKHLTVRYSYKDVSSQMTVAAGKRMSSNTLIQHIEKKNPMDKNATE
ncbi:MAG: hypothetical protein WCS94_02645 [Verrucomicrobiota bacterium]